MLCEKSTTPSLLGFWLVKYKDGHLGYSAGKNLYYNILGGIKLRAEKYSKLTFRIILMHIIILHIYLQMHRYLLSNINQPITLKLCPYIKENIRFILFT